jgi:hypothetical protein
LDKIKSEKPNFLVTKNNLMDYNKIEVNKMEDDVNIVEDDDFFK